MVEPLAGLRPPDPHGRRPDPAPPEPTTTDCPSTSPPLPTAPSAPAGLLSLADAAVRLEGSREEAELGYRGLTAGDLDGDGRLELVADEHGSNIQVLFAGDPPRDVDHGRRPSASFAAVDVHDVPGEELVIGATIAGSSFYTGGAPTVAWVRSVDRCDSSVLTLLTHRANPASSEIIDYQVHRIGDLDGDGDDDLAIGQTSSGNEPTQGVVWLLHQVQDRLELDADADARLLGQRSHARARLHSDADFDGDGLTELILSMDPPHADAHTLLVEGPLSGTLVLEPGLWFEPSDIGIPVIRAAGGDLDADGTPDLVASSQDRLEVFADPFADRAQQAIPIATLAPLDPGALSPTFASDLDGDGHDELILAEPEAAGTGVVSIWYGPVAGTVDPADADAWLISASPGEQIGDAVLGPGDLDGDGYGDLILGARTLEDHGAVYLWQGGPALP